MKKTDSSNFCKNVGKLEPFYIADGNTKWYNPLVKQVGGFLKNETYTSYMTQQFYS